MGDESFLPQILEGIGKQIVSLEAQLAAVTAERDEWRAITGLAGRSVDDARDKMEELELAQYAVRRERDALAKRLNEAYRALAFASSCIRSGEPWTETCEEVIGTALGHKKTHDAEAGEAHDEAQDA